MSFDVPLAKKAVAINGIKISWLLVISITITNEVSGDCNMPEKYAVMVSKIIAEAGAIGNQFAKLTPNPAPVASDGTKIPLGMPLKKVAQVASIFRNG